MSAGRTSSVDAVSGTQMSGDNTNGPDAWHPASSDIVGRLWFYVPGAARLISWLRQPQVIASLAAAFAVVLILMWLPTARATESAAAR